MRFLLKWLLILGFFAALGYGGIQGKKYWEQKQIPVFRMAKVTEGKLVSVVNSTGEVKPVLSVSVGTFVSGPIEKLHVDFNDKVTKGQLMAEIDSRLFEAAVAEDRALLGIRQAEVKRVESDLELAKLDLDRANRLRDRGEGFVSQVEVDQFRFKVESLEAQARIAEAGVKQAEAGLSNSEANLEFTRIVSPVDGVVIDRKIEPGQTLAAQFQTPELFVVAPDLRDEMHLFASVDEADIGLIREAAKQEQPVQFTVDAYPDDLFVGKVVQIRLSPIVAQNVVTYPVVVSAENKEQKLMPGMTASLSFQTGKRDRCVRIPNAALRFFPKVEHVRPEDKHLVLGVVDEQAVGVDIEESAQEKTALAAKRTKRYVWVWETPFLRAIPVTIGIRDSQWSELVEGNVLLEDELVIAEKK
ncbi:MAG: efflux RND transporter periplasmic adaptor subunit [Rubripirellula sp.]